MAGRGQPENKCIAVARRQTHPTQLAIAVATGHIAVATGHIAVATGHIAVATGRPPHSRPQGVRNSRHLNATRRWIADN
eukprot:349894-Chlamydomonas_euryale.AAC.15